MRCSRARQGKGGAAPPAVPAVRAPKGAEAPALRAAWCGVCGTEFSADREAGCIQDNGYVSQRAEDGKTQGPAATGGAHRYRERGKEEKTLKVASESGSEA